MTGDCGLFSEMRYLSKEGSAGGNNKGWEWVFGREVCARQRELHMQITETRQNVAHLVNCKWLRMVSV